MKNKYWILLIFIIFIILGIIIYSFYSNKKNTSNYDAKKTSSSNELNNTNNLNNIDKEETEKDENQIEKKHNDKNNIPVAPPIEENIASFSTKIYTKEASRQSNITITCSKINDIIIQNNSSFSFCNTVGPATTSKGYKEADIFDNKGNKKKGLGGGNCQVSTTLYNAVLQIPNLVILERHQHSNKVPYIQTGKDAAVAYGSYDLKFRNDTGFNIKIKAQNTPDAVNITIIKIKNLG